MFACFNVYKDRVCAMRQKNNVIKEVHIFAHRVDILVSLNSEASLKKNIFTSLAFYVQFLKNPLKCLLQKCRMLDIGSPAAHT